MRGKRFTTERPEAAFTIFGEWAAGVLAQIGGTGLLAHVPSASATALEDDPKGEKLAATIANLASGYTAFSMLCWAEAMQKSSQGGTRNPGALYENLKVRQEIEPQNIVLIDDVVTTGNHLRSCADALRSFGHTVEHAIAAAQTVKQTSYQRHVQHSYTRSRSGPVRLLIYNNEYRTTGQTVLDWRPLGRRVLAHRKPCRVAGWTAASSA